VEACSACLRCSERSGAFGGSELGLFSEPAKRRPGAIESPSLSLLADLQELRRARGYSVRELATRAKVDHVTVVRVENEHTEPQPRTLRRFAEALDVDVGFFYSEEPITPLAQVARL
jgi:ribosome-binding protein aMBF1 (putative translation factor)